MALSKHGRGMGVVYTVEGGGRKVTDRGERNGRGELGLMPVRGEGGGINVERERGINVEREGGRGRRERELVCTCSARERIRRSIGSKQSLNPPI